MTSAPTAAPPFEHRRPAASNTVFKSGPLFISSKGIGWKSWKKRWFILTRTSLVFFKTDPSVLPQKNGEVNLTLGGIDLNNSGSVVVREDKKLLTVLFPDGRDGRAFTLKAETSEDLFEWKTALELALAQAPNAALVMGHNGIFRNDNPDTFEGSIQTWNKRPAKSLVVGRPILLALEDIDGGPSFLEKALRFLEEYGMKVEGILRQSADVEEVDKRVQEYEHGKTEFTSDEDAHVVGDCVKHVLRELPSSPVPASCCTALLEAYRLENKEARVNAMRLAISETFPEPNRRLLQRILKMMNTIAAHTAENRMSASAVAACMAPLLLRPLLAGECELEDEFDMNEDTSAQLLAAANAANNAQAIVTTLMEEFQNIFDEDSLHRCSSPDSQMDESESDELTDDERVEAKGNGYHDADEDTNPVTNNDLERVLSGKLSESSGYSGRDLYDYKVFANDDSDEESTKYVQSKGKSIDLERGSQTQYSGNGLTQLNLENTFSDKDSPKVLPVHDGRDSTLSMGEILSSLDGGMSFGSNINDYCVEKHTNKVNGSNSHTKRSNFWGRNTGKKNQSSESVDSSGEEELAIQRLESTKNDLRMRIAKEAKGNAILQASLERRKQALHERRLALEHDVSRLQEQLQAERDLRAALEVGLSMSSGQFTSSRSMDSKTRAELEEIALAEADVTRLKQKVAELHLQLNQQRQDRIGSFTDDCSRYQHHATNISPQRVLQQGFDRSIACCNHEKKQKSEESSSGTDWRTNKPQPHPITNIKQLSRQRSFETTPNEMKVSDAAYGTCSEPNSASSSTSGSKLTSEGIDFRLNQPSAAIASATLLELTTRLDFFKERRSQLMEQLHNLDRNHEAPSLSQAYRSSPPWNHSPR